MIGSDEVIQKLRSGFAAGMLDLEGGCGKAAILLRQKADMPFVKAGAEGGGGSALHQQASN